MNRRNYKKELTFILGLLFIAISIVINNINYIRIILNIIGILILTYSCVIEKEKKLSIAFFILISLISILVDSIIVMTVPNRIPIFSYNIITNGNNKVHNAIGYRVWDCEGKKLKVDRLYKLGYYCDASDMEAIDINAFLSSVVKEFNDYKNTYIKVNGKINKKESNNYIEMQSYQASEITLNGYVNFSDDVTLRIIFNDKDKGLETYDIYDNVSVVGRIFSINERNGKYTIIMDDSKVVSNDNLSEYKVIVNSNNNCEFDKTLLYQGSDYNVYTHCLSNVLIKFNEESIYEIGSVLSSGKLKIADFLKNSTNVVKGDDSSLYEFENYNIIKCNEELGSDVIIGDSNLTLDDGYCGVILDEE